MRQIESFSKEYRRLMRDCLAWAAGLIAWVWVGVMLHLDGVDIRLVYLIVSIIIGIHLFKTAIALSRETRRMAHEYWSYLDLFSYQVLHRIRNDQDMSSWSRSEISRYLNLAMHMQF